MPTYDPLPSKWGQAHWGQGFWNPVVTVAANCHIHSLGSLSTGVTTHVVQANCHIHSNAFQRNSTFAGQAKLHIHTAAQLTPAYIAALAHIHSRLSGTLQAQHLSVPAHIHSDGLLFVTIPASAFAQIHSSLSGALFAQPRTEIFAHIHSAAQLTLLRGRVEYAWFRIHSGSNDSYLEVENSRFVLPQRIPQPDKTGKGGGSRYVSQTLVWAICPRCGFRYRLSEMREEIYDQRPTGRRVCPECFDTDDPHLRIRDLDITDAGLVYDPLPHPQQQSTVYAAALSPVQFGEPIQVLLGAVYLSRDGADITPPTPPMGPGMEFGRMARRTKGVLNATR